MEELAEDEDKAEEEGEETNEEGKEGWGRRRRRRRREEERSGRLAPARHSAGRIGVQCGSIPLTPQVFYVREHPVDPQVF